MIKDEQIQAFLKDLGSDSPAPGGGAASAVSGATGVSLALMVLSLTLNKPKYAELRPELLALKKQLLHLRSGFYLEADRDKTVFLGIMDAYSLPKKTAEEKSARKKALQKALIPATKAPLSVMDKAVKALRLTEKVATLGDKGAISDAGVAGATLESALLGASFNVEINLRVLQEGPKKAAFRSKADALLQEGRELASRIRRIVLERIEANR